MPYAAVAFAASAWGTWGIVIRHTDAMGAMPVALESTLVMAVITLVSGAASLWDRVRVRASWRARAWVAWLGVADALNILLFFAAYKLTIAVSVLTHYLAPVFVAAAAPIVLGEPMTRRSLAAISASFAGLAIMLAPAAGVAGSPAMWTSAALGAGSAVFYASNVIVNKFVVDHFSTSETMFWHGVVGTPVLAAFVPHDAWTAIDPALRRLPRRGQHRAGRPRRARVRLGAPPHPCGSCLDAHPARAAGVNRPRRGPARRAPRGERSRRRRAHPLRRPGRDDVGTPLD